MKDIFEKATINGMTLQNRLVRSATWEGCVKQTAVLQQSLPPFTVTWLQAASA